jgi:hypothetical protein
MRRLRAWPATGPCTRPIARPVRLTKHAGGGCSPDHGSVRLQAGGGIYTVDPSGMPASLVAPDQSAATAAAPSRPKQAPAASRRGRRPARPACLEAASGPVWPRSCGRGLGPAAPRAAAALCPTARPLCGSHAGRPAAEGQTRGGGGVRAATRQGTPVPKRRL